MGKQRAAGGAGIQVRPPARGSIHILRNTPRGRVEAAHLTSKALELFHGNVTRATQCRSFLNKISCGIKLSGGKRFAAFSSPWRVQDVGGRVQVALRMAANQLPCPW